MNMTMVGYMLESTVDDYIRAMKHDFGGHISKEYFLSTLYFWGISWELLPKYLQDKLRNNLTIW